MRALAFGLVVAIFAAAASAQNSTTTCYAAGATVHCNTQQQSGVDWGAFNQQQQQIQQQQQENFARLGAALAASRARHEQEKRLKAIKAAMEADQAPPLPPPPDEKPVMLACTLDRVSGTMTLALYEKHGRVDVSAGGVTHSRSASFTENSVDWTGPVWRSEVSRMNLSYTGYGAIPAVDGEVVSGSCQLAQKQF